MSSAPSDVRNRIMSAIQRASGLEEKLKQDRLESEVLSSPTLSRVVADVRRLARELHLSFEDLAQTIAEQVQAKDAAATALRHATAMFRLSPTPCVITDGLGTVIDINAAAAELLNVTPRHVVGRPFLLFLGSDRETFLNLLSQTRHIGDVQRCDGHIRPRERAPFDAMILMAPDPSEQVLLMLLPPRNGRTALEDAQAATDLLGSAYNLRSRRRRIGGNGEHLSASTPHELTVLSDVKRSPE